MKSKKILFSAILTVLSALIAALAAEGVIRIKNSSMRNYDIEMWRYSRELKTPSADPILGHEHVKNVSALLQSVELRTNEWGLRGGSVASEPQGRRILFLGSSITLGWGVPEKDTVTARLEEMLRAEGQRVEVLNGGIGNYNTERYTKHFLTRLKDLHPTDIVVMYFLRDAEKLEAGGGNWFLRNSQLAVTVWIAATRLLEKTGEASLTEHYQRVYDPSEPGYIAMKESFAKLALYAKEHGIRVYVAMTPDVHNLQNYRFGFIHESIKDLSEQQGFCEVDMLSALRNLPPEQIWAMPGDPHPNALGHKLMAEAIFPMLSTRQCKERCCPAAN